MSEIKPIEKASLTANYIKVGLFLLISVAMVIGNFFLETKLAGSSALQDNSILSDGIIRFDDGKSASESFKNSIFEFDSGKFWGNFSVSDAKVNIVHKNVVFIPNRAVFDLALNDERLELNVYDGDVYLGFLPDDVKVTNYLDPFSDLFMNRMLVPRDNQVTIPLKKVNENIRPLLYSKLVKEFKYAFVPESLKDSEWVKQNTAKDNQEIETLKQKFSADVIYDGVKVQDGLLSDFIFWSEENLTFAPGKNREKIFEHLFAFLDDAIFYLNNGDSVSSDQFLVDFDAYLATLPVTVTQSEDYYAKLDYYIDKLTIFKPGDSQYKILKFVLDKKFYSKRDIYSVVNSFWLNVYDGIDRGDSAAEEALNDYYKYFSAAGDIFTDRDLHRVYLSYQNQLFDNLLLKYPVFYRDGYFAIKTIFEENLLKSYEDGALKGELKQAFLSNKIDFMKRLKKFFFEGKLEVKEAREIFKRLFKEISDLMPKDQDLAVIELFESQLADMNDFFGYLSTPEYQAKLYGATHEERFKAYLEERSTIWSFINIKEDVLGESTQKEKISVVEVVDQVEEDLKKYEDISDFEIGKIEDVDQRFVGVNLVLGGYPVSASFDRDNGTLKDIYVYEELISESAVKINNLLSVLQEKFADLANEMKAEDEDEVTLETSAKRYARVYIAKKVAEYGFSATMENVSVIDELNAVYRVENVVLKEKPDLKITFDIAMGDELVTNVLISLKGKPKVLDGKYSLEEFAAIVIAESELSVEKKDEEVGDKEKTPKKILR